MTRRTARRVPELPGQGALGASCRSGLRGAARLPIVIALASLAVLFWYCRLILPAQMMMFGASDDPYGQIYPMAFRAAAWIKEGILPLWNPYQFSGHPFLATVLYGVFYPPNVLLLLLPTEVAMEVSAAAHLFLAALFTWAYLRQLDFESLPAFAGAITYAFSGFYASQAAWFMPAWGAAVWLPASLFAIEKLFASGAPRWAAALALCVAMPVLAGWLQSFVYTMYMVGAYLGVRSLAALCATDSRSAGLRAALLGGAGIVLGLALTSVQLLPSMELQSLGPRRPGGLSVAQSVSTGVMFPGQLMTDAINPKPGFPRPAFVGDLALVLLPLCLLALRRRPIVGLFLLVSGFSLLVALTTQTPVLNVYRLLPASTWFRYPTRILFLHAFAASVLVSTALEYLSGAVPRTREAWVAAMLVALSGAYWISEAPDALAVTAFAVPMILALATTIVRGAQVRQVLLAVLVAAQVVTLFFATSSKALHPWHDTGVLDRERPLWEKLRAEQGTSRTYIHYASMHDFSLTPKQGVLQGIYSITDYEPLTLDRSANYYRAMAATPPGPADELAPFIGMVNVDLRQSPSQRFLNMLGVRYAVVPAFAGIFRSDLARLGWIVHAQNPKTGTLLYTNPGALPRTWIVPVARWVDGGDEALAAISDPAFRPLQSAVLESEGTRPADVPSGGSVSSREDPGAWIEEYAPSRVRIRVEPQRKGWLMLSDTFYPGWEATVDGRPTTIVRADSLFRAVPVDGNTSVEFFYRPRSVRTGAIVSVAALLIVVLMLLRGSRSTGQPMPIA